MRYSSILEREQVRAPSGLLGQSSECEVCAISPGPGPLFSFFFIGEGEANLVVLRTYSWYGSGDNMMWRWVESVQLRRRPIPFEPALISLALVCFPSVGPGELLHLLLLFSAT